jgi:hypothetical protein
MCLVCVRPPSNMADLCLGASELSLLAPKLPIAVRFFVICDSEARATVRIIRTVDNPTVRLPRCGLSNRALLQKRQGTRNLAAGLAPPRQRRVQLEIPLVRPPHPAARLRRQLVECDRRPAAVCGDAVILIGNDSYSSKSSA